MAVIETRGLGKTYQNGVRGLEDLSLSVAPGEIFGFLGPNGAGKTTTVRLLNGTLEPTEGESRVLGMSSRDEAVRMMTATIGELAQMYDHLTVRENLLFFAALYDIEVDVARQRAKDLLATLRLEDRTDQKLGTLSTGLRKRVQLARALLHRPKIVFLDEPTSGLDPDASSEVTGLIRSLAEKNGTTIFLCTHNLTLADSICDGVGLINEGRLVVAGKKDQLIESVTKRKVVEITTEEKTHSLEYEETRQINALVRSVLDAGEYILDVTVIRPTLEDLYFHHIGRKLG